MLNACAELLVNRLKAEEINFRCGTDQDGDSIVDVPYGDKLVKMIFSNTDGHYLSIFAIYEQVPEDKIVDMIFACNELNSTFMWVTFFVDKMNNLVLHDDAILSISDADEEAMELLTRIVNIGDKARPMIEKVLQA